MDKLDQLVEAYRAAPEIYQVGRYWKAYEDKVIEEVKKADLQQLRSGAYPIFGTFGFSESIYHYNQKMSLPVKLAKKAIRSLFITKRALLPYSLRLEDIRHMAFINCVNQGNIAGLKSIRDIETSRFGNPSDLFEMEGKQYTMQFLNFYLRLCFAQKHLQLQGDETIIELGTGSGFQTEILKKVFPDLTILCFDLPYTLTLCEEYMTQTFGKSEVVGSLETLSWQNLNSLKKGKIHMIGNWKFPIIKSMPHHVFWNAASFGEMEPHIVQNYLSYVLGSCSYVFLLQANKGKESTSNTGVQKPILFEDYMNYLDGYKLLEKADAYEAHRKMSQSGGYFQAVWSNK